MDSPGEDPQHFPSLEEAIEALRTKLDQEPEGTIVFQIRESNLSSEESDGNVIQEVVSNSGDKGIRLWKKEGNQLIYEFFELNVGLKRCAISLDEFHDYSNFFVSLTWSPDEISPSIGPFVDEYDGDLITESTSEIISQIRRDENGHLVILGDTGVEVGYYRIQEGSRETLRPRAREVFEFTETKARTLLKVAKDTDEFLVESTIIQQIIVMMVTGLETYLEERFVELCTEMNLSEEEIVKGLAAMTHESLSEDDLLKQAQEGGIPIQELARDRYVNFQNIGEAHNIYSKTIGFNLQRHLNKTGNRGPVERNIEARHSIIHEAADMTILNFDRVPPQEPVFANHENGQQIVATFSETVEKLHQKTESLE